MKKTEKRKYEIDGLFVRLYENWAAERITEYSFNMLTAKYQTEQGELMEKIEVLTADVEAVRRTESDAKKWLAIIRQTRGISRGGFAKASSPRERPAGSSATPWFDSCRTDQKRGHPRGGLFFVYS